MNTVSSEISSAQSSDLVFVSQTNELVTDSFHVAKYFGKRHDNVIQKVRRLGCSGEFAALNFKVCHKNNNLQGGKIQPFYQMTKDGFIFLVMGFTGKRADEIKERYINAFNEMQKKIENKGITINRSATQVKLLITIEGGRVIGSKALSGDDFLTSPDNFSKRFSEIINLFTIKQLSEIACVANNKLAKMVSK